MPTRSEVLRARRKAVGGRRPRCRKGKSCSAACINRNKYCLVDAPTPVAGALPRAIRAIQSRRERLKPREKRSSDAVQELRYQLNKGAREGVSGIRVKGYIRSQFYVTSSVLGNRLVISVSPNDSTSFTVNGSHTASDTLSRREQVAIIRESRRQYDEIFKSMPDGTVFAVTAAEGDGREGMRERGYTDRGFSAPDENGRMFGKIVRGGVVPIDEDEYDASWGASRGY